ncbi:MAG: carboxypeptidase-like regulatory domain-containing protein [candidate division WOR-3 bacterium]|jgi:hypothetical protein
MKTLSITIILVLLAVITCIEPDRNAHYDPNNPNKPSLYGYTRNYEWSPLPGATVELRQGGDVKYSTMSDNDAWFEFPEINPGIYELYGEAEYYNPCVDTVYLCAGCRDTIDVHFQELYFHFDNEAPGTQEPFGFAQVFGSWQVQEDNTEPDLHSTPNVYNAVHDGSSAPFALALLRDTLEDFFMSTSIKVLGPSSNWHAGLILRYQSEIDYYVIQLLPGALSLMKMQNGNLTQLATSTSYTFAPDTWYYIAAYLHENKIKIYLDHDEIFEIYDTSSPFYSGLAGLWLYTSEPTGSATAHFDDVYLWP